MSNPFGRTHIGNICKDHNGIFVVDKKTGRCRVCMGLSGELQYTPAKSAALADLASRRRAVEEHQERRRIASMDYLS